MTTKILKFSATWCAPCKALSKVMQGVDLGVPVEEVDIDIYPELAMDYNIRSVPTLVLIENGAAVKSLTGVKTVDQLKDWIGK